MRIDDHINRIRREAQKMGMSYGELAKAARLHKNTIIKMHRKDWSPNATTLRKMERVVLRRPSGKR